ncbi:DUF4190 domain-containing protein [Streptomyces sp. NPDC005492]|uniref:DUF4190 domain-containing protein n=1 Tax=Streptomyces sp. NPDC005492 TaxID=3156883 RepID=UPI0033ABD750
MGDQTQPDGGAGANNDPWAPPESKPSLEKGAQPPAPGAQPYPPAPGQQPYPQDQPPAAAQQPPPQPSSVHFQPTMTAMPSDGFAPPAPGYGQPGTPPGLPSYGAPTYGPPHAPGGYGYPGYPQGYGWPGMPMAPQNNMGTAAMVLGILSCCLFCIYGIVSLGLGITAIVLGVKGKKRADRGEATNRGQAQAGLITGIVGTVLGVITIAAMIIGIAFAVKHDNDNTTDSDPYYNSAPSLTAPVQPGA